MAPLLFFYFNIYNTIPLKNGLKFKSFKLNWQQEYFDGKPIDCWYLLNWFGKNDRPDCIMCARARTGRVMRVCGVVL